MSTAAEPARDKPGNDKPGRRPGHWSRWLLAVVAAAALLGVALLIWLVPAGRSIMSGNDRRNQADLTVAAAGLEQWSAAVVTLARANFIKGRVETLAPDERDHDEGWRLRSWQRHPALDEFKINYAVTSDARCKEIKATITDAEGRLPFVDNYNGGSAGFLKIVDSFPLALIRNEDLRGNATPADAHLATIAGGIVLQGARNEKPDLDKAVVCFVAGIPIDRLLVLDKAARSISNLLVVDATGRVAAQVGNERLPLKSLAGLVPQSSVLARSLAASVGQPVAANDNQPRLADSLKPVEIDINGRSYTAYVRPLAPPKSFDVCKPARPPLLQTVSLAAGEPDATGGRRVMMTPLAAPTGAEAPPAPAALSDTPNACLIVALVPTATVWRQVVTLPTALLVTMGLAVITGLALLPSLRLLLLGPGEAIGRAEAIGVVLGLPAVVSLTTLALLFAADLGAHRNAAARDARTIATRAAGDAANQVVKAAAVMADAAAIKRLASFPSPAGRTPNPKLAVDPVAARYPAGFCHVWADSRLPVFDSMGVIDEDGRPAVGIRTAACRDSLGGRSNVSARDYFLRVRTADPALMDGDHKGHPYVIQQVSALQDGVSKSVMAMRASELKNPSDVQQRQDRSAYFIVGTATLTSVMAPVLPPPFGLMVVDTREDSLPVLLHAVPGRAGAEKLGIILRDPAPIREKLRALHVDVGGGAVGPASFQAFYDGANRHFIAAPIAGTRWVAVASYSLADIDRAAADTAIHTLRSWAAFSIVFTLAWVMWLAWRGQQGWPRLWPTEGHRDRYRRLRNHFAWLGGIGGLLIVAFGAALPAVMVFAGLLVRLLAALGLHVVLGHSRGARRPWFATLPVLAPVFRHIDAAEATTGPLQPETERLYKQMLIALIVCLSIVPMLGFWREAHEHSVEVERRATFVALGADDGPLAVNARTLDRLRWAYGIAAPATAVSPRILGLYEVTVAGVPSAHDAPDGATFFSTFFDTVAGEASLPAAPACSGCDDGAAVRLCGIVGTKPGGIDVAGPRWSDIGTMLKIALLVAAAAAAALLHWLLTRVLRGLAGFGIALEAFEPPAVFLGDLFLTPTTLPERADTEPQVLVLNRKSLLVNAPAVVVRMLRHGNARLQEINVADQVLADTPIVEGMVVIVSGLELVIADPGRRVRALALLERQRAALSRLGPGNSSRLLVLSESAPLERILDAFERDENRTGVDTERENLRWSRLFEGFATYGFRQARLTGSPELPERIAAKTSDPAQRKTIAAACDELRWLPQNVAAAAIGKELLLPNDTLKSGIVPVPDAIYQEAFEGYIVDWAARRRFPGKAAVRAHLRNQCIEYYQKLWSSSTNAEHLVMHHLATGRFVNIGVALAFGSLVRRGVIVFDPEPRLMNDSFAMFVRQAEKLDTIRSWQGELPRSAWVMARLPIFAVIGVLVAGLVTVVALSGESVVALLPVLAAGIPALVAAGQRLLSR